MSATLAMKNVKVKAYANPTTIPDDPIGKLMYYLNCVSEVVECENSRLTDYQNYKELTKEESEKVYKLAKEFPPSKFINAGIFILDQKLLFEFTNHFYEITDETIGFHASREIIIGGQVRKVVKLMACNHNWLSSYYFIPMQQIENAKRNRSYQSQIINTQTSIYEKTPIVITSEFKSSPISIGCPYCDSIITTKTESKFNFLACICCLMFPVFYCFFQVCSDRNLCCCDVSHRCPKCGAILGHYNSC